MTRLIFTSQAYSPPPVTKIILPIVHTILAIGKRSIAYTKGILADGRISIRYAKIILAIGKCCLAYRKHILVYANTILADGRITLGYAKTIPAVGKHSIANGKSILAHADTIPADGKNMLAYGSTTFTDVKIILAIERIILSGGKIIFSSIHTDPIKQTTAPFLYRKRLNISMQRILKLPDETKVIGQRNGHWFTTLTTINY